jgi:DNA modification methylase
MSENKIVKLENGYAILGSFPEDVKQVLEITGKFPLCIADPPYGNIVSETWDKTGNDDSQFANVMINWTLTLEQMMLPNSAFYIWGGIGKKQYRPLYKYLSRVEEETNFEIASHITWSKRRAYGLKFNYLFTREELIYLTLGDTKHPRLFNIPLLEKLRGYDGYNPKYKAKSPFLRRTNVWTDITEIFKGKTHPCAKPVRLSEIIINIHTNPGEYILDAFSGSGNASLAARNLNRKFIAIEKDEETFDKIVERLK